MVVVVCGAKRSGKDSISNILASSYNYINIKISADLKLCCKQLFGFTDDQLENSAKDEIDTNWGIRPRQAMQFLGTDVMQFKLQELLPNVGRDFWIKKTITHLKETIQPVVISDLRFLHEYNLLKETYGDNLFVVRVERQKVKEIQDTHLSEIEWENIPYDYIIKNDKDMNTLEWKVKHMYESFKKTTN
jgi:hypothetical protein